MGLRCQFPRKTEKKSAPRASLAFASPPHAKQKNPHFQLMLYGWKRSLPFFVSCLMGVLGSSVAHSILALVSLGISHTKLIRPSPPA